MKASQKKPIVIGIGQNAKGDESLGIHVVKFLNMKFPDMAEYILLDKQLTYILDYWHERDVIIINATYFNKSNAGKITIYRSVDQLIHEKSQPLPADQAGLIEAIQIGQLLNRVPVSFFFVGLEGEQYNTGNKLSERVLDAIPFVEWRIINYIKKELEVNQSIRSFLTPTGREKNLM